MKEEKSQAGNKVLLEDIKGEEEKEKTGKTLLPDVDISSIDTLMGKLDEFSDKKTLVEQDRITYEKMKSEGKNPKDSFRVTGITEKGDGNAELNIVTSGEKGEESAKKTLSSLKQYPHVSVKSETGKRYEKEDQGSQEEFGNWIVRRLETLAVFHSMSGDEETAKKLMASARDVKEKCMGAKIDEKEKAEED